MVLQYDATSPSNNSASNRRVLQAGRGRADLSNRQQVASALPARLPAAAGFLALFFFYRTTPYKHALRHALRRPAEPMATPIGLMVLPS